MPETRCSRVGLDMVVLVIRPREAKGEDKPVSLSKTTDSEPMLEKSGSKVRKENVNFNLMSTVGTVRLTPTSGASG